MKIERLSGIFRVWGDSVGLPDYFVLCGPSYLGDGIRDFIAGREGYGVISMFSCKVESDEQAIEFALSNLPDYIDDPVFND